MASIQIKFFAHLREYLKRDCIEVTVDALANLSIVDLMAYLSQTIPEFKEYTAKHAVLIAINQELVDLNTEFSPDDEIAMFPPVTGG